VKLVVGTHCWRTFVRPEEPDQVFWPVGFTMESYCGVDFNPLQQKWRIIKNPNSIYLRLYKRGTIKDE
jgi:2-polyprenyl-3-methyl-5-hydroxy-6-metoxy-1,4-benzoquinol methylase